MGDYKPSMTLTIGYDDPPARALRAVVPLEDYESLAAELAEARAEIQNLGKRELDYKELHLEARGLLREGLKLCIDPYWSGEYMAKADAFLARTEGKCLARTVGADTPLDRCAAYPNCLCGGSPEAERVPD